MENAYVDMKSVALIMDQLEIQAFIADNGKFGCYLIYGGRRIARTLPEHDAPCSAISDAWARSNVLAWAWMEHRAAGAGTLGLEDIGMYRDTQLEEWKELIVKHMVGAPCAE